MADFNFSYTDSIKRIKCIYTFNDKVDRQTSWEGYVIAENVDGLLNIEGIEQDGMSPKDDNGEPHFRYLLGTKAISHAHQSLIFEVYPDKMCPIHYNMYYSEKDGCFYGDWWFTPYTYEHPCVYSNPCNRCGHAVIYLEDVDVKDNHLRDSIKKAAEYYQKEYKEEIDYFTRLACDRLLLSDYDITSVYRRLSKYSDRLKEEKK